MFLSLTLTPIILFLLLELGVNKVHVKVLLLPLEWVTEEVVIICHGLVEANGDPVQDDVDELIVSHLSIDIESIDIIQVFLDSTCLLEITDLIKSPVWLAMVDIVFPYGIPNLFPDSILVTIYVSPLLHFYSHT